MDGRAMRRSGDFTRGCWVEVTRAKTTANPAFYDIGIIEHVVDGSIQYRSSDGRKKFVTEWNATVIPSPQDIKTKGQEIQDGWSSSDKLRRLIVHDKPVEVETIPPLYMEDYAQ